MNRKIPLLKLLIVMQILTVNCTSNQNEEKLSYEVYETASNGNQLKQLTEFTEQGKIIEITINENDSFQKILGFGGSFTEASAYNLFQLNEANRNKIIEAYFGDSGARYSICRTHINSCDFSLGNYSYAETPNDRELKDFSIQRDEKYLIPMMKLAQQASSSGFDIIASPWTAPPWMKDNNDWKGGKLKTAHYPTWALFFTKYIEAYKNNNIDIWGISVENEPLGNDNNWESMHYSPDEMNDFVKNFLAPQFKSKGITSKILGYDQNRDEEIKTWADAQYDDASIAACYDGMAVHWYGSTESYFPEMLQYVHQKNTSKLIIQTEACIDAEKPRWKNDAWYWSKTAKDWGYTWASQDKKHLHPLYVPAFRYARDIIGCLNNNVNAWIDWNMVLDKEGGPNWAKNWCVAPVIVDTENSEVYFTPLYYIMAQFSRFIRPDAVRLGVQVSQQDDIQTTAVKNPDGELVLLVFNPNPEPKQLHIKTNQKVIKISINPEALQTIRIAKA